MDFHRLSVTQVFRSTPQSITVTFDIPPTLQEKYKYLAGQYLVLKVPYENEEVRREYSLCSAPFEGDYQVTIKAIENGKISNHLQQVQVGDTLEVSEPLGRFTIPYKPKEKRTIAFFAAGSGITPIISHIKELLFQEPDVQVYLFYGNTTQQNTIFYKELLSLKDAHPKQLYPYFFFSQEKTEDPLFTGRIDSHKVALIKNQLIDWDEIDEILLCGPQEMMIEIRQNCIDNGIPESCIHIELFTQLVNTSPTSSHQSEQQNVAVEVVLEKQTYTLSWNQEGDSLLDAILDEGIDAPYSCKGGVCGACTCKLENGNVEMEEQLVLMDSELNQGLFLPCQTFKTSDVSLKINFDKV